MSDFDFSDLGRQISETVHDALNSKEVEDLKNTIKNTTSMTMEEVKRSVSDAMENVNRSIKESVPASFKEKTNKIMVPIRRSAKDKSGYIVMLVLGIIFASIFGMTAIGFLITTLVSGLFDAVPIALGVVSAVCVFIAISGGKKIGIVNRFRRYTKELEKQGFCSIETLSRKVGKQDFFVIKDLKRMTNKGWFLEGHLDEHQTCFIATDEAYNQYMTAEDSLKQRRLEEEQRRKEEELEAEKLYSNPEALEVKEMVSEGKKYIDQIRQANDDIPQKDISDKLAHLELVSICIFNYVEAHSEKLPEIRKYMNYYLPTTLKLVEAYKEFNNQPIQGENIIKSKKEIEETIDKINYAFENLLNQLYGENMLDISTDITALSTMLAQEGLLGSDFKEENTNG